jgi:hypothetical protein
MPDDDHLVEPGVLDHPFQIRGQGLDRILGLALGLGQTVASKVVEDETVVAQALELVMPDVGPEGGPVDEHRATLRLGSRLLDEDLRSVIQLDRSGTDPTTLAEWLRDLDVVKATAPNHGALCSQTRTHTNRGSRESEESRLLRHQFPDPSPVKKRGTRDGTRLVTS